MKRNTKNARSQTPTEFVLADYEAMLGKVEGFRITVESLDAEGKVIGKEHVENVSALHRTSDKGTEILYVTGKVSLLGQAQQFALNLYAIGSKAAAAAVAGREARKASAEADRK